MVLFLYRKENCDGLFEWNGKTIIGIRAREMSEIKGDNNEGDRREKARAEN